MNGPVQMLGDDPVPDRAPPTEADVICIAANTLVHFCHGASRKSGWWTDLGTGQPIDPFVTPHLIPAKLMLVVSEVSEAMEAHRKGLADDKLPHRLGLEVELADAVIRIADLCGALGLDLGGAIAEKMAFNARREDHTLAHRAGANGKAY